MKYNVALLEADIRDELENLNMLAREFDAIMPLLALKEEEITFFDKSATGYFLHNFYNGCENIFRLIARFFENDLGPQSWHRDLLKRMKLEIQGYRPRLIDEETFNLLNELRSFRHVFRHSYSFHLDWEREKVVAIKYPTVWKKLNHQVEAFIETLQKIESDDS